MPDDRRPKDRRYRIDRWRKWSSELDRMVDEFTVVDDRNHIVGVFRSYGRAEKYIETVLMA